MGTNLFSASGTRGAIDNVVVEIKTIFFFLEKFEEITFTYDPVSRMVVTLNF